MFWALFAKSVVRGTHFLTEVRAQVETDRYVDADTLLVQTLGKREVVYGPFLGMRYGDVKARCSALYPKLLGTYEAEITPHLERMIACKPPTIIDVGAADGYYAVGMAMRLAESRVVAYEQSARAQRELLKLARLNGAEGRIQIRGRCHPEDLLGHTSDKGLVLMDCEGAEAFLITQKVIAALRRFDFLIETHEGLAAGVTAKLLELFSQTHECIQIKAVPDLDRPTEFWPSGINAMADDAAKRLMLRESRMHATTGWLACYSKQ